MHKGTRWFKLHEVMRLKIPLRITNCNSMERGTRGTEAVGKIMAKERPKFFLSMRFWKNMWSYNSQQQVILHWSLPEFHIRNDCLYKWLFVSTNVTDLRILVTFFYKREYVNGRMWLQKYYGTWRRKGKTVVKIMGLWSNFAQLIYQE